MKLLTHMGLVDTTTIAESDSMVIAEIQRCAILLPVQERLSFEAKEEAAWAAVQTSECYKFYANIDNAAYAQLAASQTIDRLRWNYPPWATSQRYNVGVRWSVGNVNPKHDHEE